MSKNDDVAGRLADWLTTRIEGAEEVRVGGLGRVEVGHSAEMLLVTLEWRAEGAAHRQDAVVRLRPPSPGLLEPYEMERQFRVLRGLEATKVKAPRGLYFEPSGEVLGRSFFIMDRLPGRVFEERSMPPDLVSDPARAKGVCTSYIDQIAEIHNVDLDATGLRWIGDGASHLRRELDRWQGETKRVARGPLPALERLEAELRKRQPAPTPRITLIHGDPKPGNFAFVGSEVSAVFDWEMCDIGDPMTDVGYAEVLWPAPGFTSHEASPTRDEFVARWEQRTGLVAHDRGWYRALQCYKLATIMLLGAWLVDAGHSGDRRLAEMCRAFPLFTMMGLSEFGITGALDHGSYEIRPERLAEIA